MTVESVAFMIMIPGPGLSTLQAATQSSSPTVRAVAAEHGEPMWSVRQKRRRIPRKVSLAIVLVVLAILLAAQNSIVVVSAMDSYAAVSPRTITVKVAVAPCSWTRVTDVAETLTEVQVKVETLPCPIPLPGTAELSFRDLTVSLVADLGSRVVTDANGQAIPPR